MGLKLLQSGGGLGYDKVGQIVLQSGTGIKQLLNKYGTIIINWFLTYRLQARNQELFRAGEVSENKDTLINI